MRNTGKVAVRIARLRSDKHGAGRGVALPAHLALRYAAHNVPSGRPGRDDLRPGTGDDLRRHVGVRASDRHRSLAAREGNQTNVHELKTDLQDEKHMQNRNRRPGGIGQDGAYRSHNPSPARYGIQTAGNNQ